MNRLTRGAVAGAAGATAWALAEPILRRVYDTNYSDVRLAGRLLTRGRLWPLAGIAAHTAFGAGLGVALVATEQTTTIRALLGSQAENFVAWPAMALVDRVHPDRRDGNWPPLLTNPSVFAQSASGHALSAICFATSFRRLAGGRPTSPP